MNYPLFRLTVFMAAGIFFFDRFFPDISVVWLFAAVSVLSLLYLIFPFRSGLVTGIPVPGVLFSFIFFILGGLVVITERKTVFFEWSNDTKLYTGTVITPPKEKGKAYCTEVLVDRVSSVNDSIYSRTGEFQAVNRSVLLYYMTDSVSPCKLECGDRVMFLSGISRPSADIDFMGFDYGDYLFRKGISGTGFAYSNMWKRLSDRNDLSMKQHALLCKEKIVGIYRKWNLEDDVLAVVSALTIGYKDELSPELRAVYNASGASHVLALSGLHVGIISAILFFAMYPLRLLKNGRLIQSVIVVCALWVFAFISGLSPSVVRAVTMCSLYMLASVIVENGFPGLFSLSLTAFIMLLYQPFYLFDVGFQLSFVAVLSILLFYPVFSSWYRSRYRILNYIWNAVSVSMAAQFGTLPLVLYYFGTFPTYFLVANLIVGPLAVCILLFAMSSLLIWKIPFLGTCSVWLLDFFTSLLNDSMLLVQQLWGAQITSLSINLIQLVLGFALIWKFLLFIQERKVNHVITSMVLINALLLSVLAGNVKVDKPAMFFSRNELYVRNSKGKMNVCVSPHGIHRVGNLYVGVMKDSRWRNKRSEFRITLDYVYITRGFRGELSELLDVFDIRNVILDSSLNETYSNFLVGECMKMGIPFLEISDQGSYKILL